MEESAIVPDVLDTQPSAACPTRFDFSESHIDTSRPSLQPVWQVGVGSSMPRGRYHNDDDEATQYTPNKQQHIYQTRTCT